jgi:hypothetical protein
MGKTYTDTRQIEWGVEMRDLDTIALVFSVKWMESSGIGAEAGKDLES